MYTCIHSHVYIHHMYNVHVHSFSSVPYSHFLMLPYPHSSTLPHPHSPTLTYPHSPTLSYHSPTLLYPHSPTLPYPHSPTLPYPHSPTLPYPHSPTLPYPHSLTQCSLHIVPILVIVLKVIPRLVRLLLLPARGQGLRCGHGPRENRDPLQCPLDSLLVLFKERPLKPVEHKEELREEVEDGGEDFELSQLLHSLGGGVLTHSHHGNGQGGGRGAVILDEGVDVQVLFEQVVDEPTRNLCMDAWMYGYMGIRTLVH